VEPAVDRVVVTVLKVDEDRLVGSRVELIQDGAGIHPAMVS
jgi:hypothetical protein